MSQYELHTIEMISTCSNCYLLIDKESQEAVVLDPGCDAKKIFNTIQKTNANLKYIINTHGHWDHIGANMELQLMINVPILIHELDAPFLHDMQLNLANLFLGDGNGGIAERLLNNGDIIEIGKLKIEVIHTPGHSPGGICLLCEDLLFTGDTLFKLSIGRSDLGKGNQESLFASISDKLAMLDDELIVLPGHGPASVLGYEKKNNPYFPQK